MPSEPSNHCIRGVFASLLLAVCLAGSALAGQPEKPLRSLTDQPAKQARPLTHASAGFSRALLSAPQPFVAKAAATGSPSRIRAFLYSLILPGSGEYYAGSRTMAKIFFSSEVLLWATYFGFRYYGHLRKEDYIAFAEAHARVNPSGKDHDYWVNIENFDNIHAYNETRLQQRRLDEIYPDNSDYAWQWDSTRSRLEYERIRISSDNAYSRSTFVLGGVVLNHLISAIDALRAARSRQNPDPNRMRVGVSPLPSGGLEFVVCKPF
jgi:hypothetical protein